MFNLSLKGYPLAPEFLRLCVVAVRPGD